MIQPAFEILNQRGTPMFFSDVFANRPTAGIVGRIFISTDTYAFYRDTGSGWDLIGGPGSGTITGSGTAGTLTKFTGASTIGDSIVLESGSAITINGTGKATNWYVGTPTDLTRAFAARGDANTIALWLEEYGTTSASPDIFMFKGQGNSTTPSNVLVNDSTGAISTGGYVNGALNVSSTLSSVVVNIDSVNNQANTDLILQQTYNSTTANINFRVRSSDGYVVAPNGGFETTGNINLLAAANSRNIVFSANAGVSRTFAFKTGSSSRFDLVVDGAETGSNAGGNLSFQRYNDAGSLIDSPFSIIRSTGQTFVGSQTTASGLLVVNNASSDAHIQVVGASAPSIRIDNAGTGATQRFVMGLSTATNNFIQGSTAGDICISTASSSPLLFGMWQTINATEVMRISTTNNLIVGSTTDNGNRLQVNGNVSATGNYQGLNGSLSGYLQIGSTHSVKLDITQSLSYDGIRIISNNSTTQNLLQLYHNDSYAVIETTYLGSGAYKNLLLNTQGGNVLVGNGTAGSEKLQIFGNGYFSSNVAIGGITASTILDINPASNSATDGIRIQRYNVNTYTLITSYDSVSRISAVDINSGTPILAFFRSTNGTSFTENARFSAAGNLLIGTTTDNGNKLQVNGNSSINGGWRYLDFIGATTNFWECYHYNDNTFRWNYNGAGNDEFILSSTGNAFFPLGNLGLGSTLNPGQRLYINGSLRIDGQTSGTAGGSSGQHLIINCDGTTYKIALLNN